MPCRVEIAPNPILDGFVVLLAVFDVLYVATRMVATGKRGLGAGREFWVAKL
jgi:hypothetical protein